jgi:hypothetical protein
MPAAVLDVRAKIRRELRRERRKQRTNIAMNETNEKTTTADAVRNLDSVVATGLPTQIVK